MSEKNTFARPLNILIVGAGIGGLTAALGLRKNGHNVTVYEQSKLATEFGAAVMLSPNAHGILKRFGLDAVKDGAVLAERASRFNFYDSTGFLLDTVDVSKSFHKYISPPILCRRVALHTSLKNAALSPDGEGPFVKLVTGSRIVDVDVETCTIVLGNGEKVVGDLIIGADGAKSVTRTKVHDIRPFPSGKSAYRFIVERRKTLQSPLAAEIAKGYGEFSAWYGRDRRMWFYTTHHNELLNVVCIHPDSLSQLSSNSNDAFGGLEKKEEDNKANMLKIYEGFDPRILALLELAEPSSVRLWQLLDMDPPPTRLAGGRLCLLGDAALPFLPYLGQGAASAMEDAVSLAALLLPGISLSMVPERLQIYEECRKERAEKLHGLSRAMGRDITVGISEKEKIEQETEKAEKAKIDLERLVYAHDEYDHTSQKLREYLWRKEGSQWSMPTSFGPIPASRSNLHEVNVDGSKYEYIRSCVKFQTSRSLLENLLPRTYLSLTVSGNLANASFVHTKYLNVSWLRGQSYSELAFYIHDVQCIKSDGSNLLGSFLAIVFVNSPDAVTDDREALGIPKVFCDLEPTAELNGIGASSSYSLRASWQGFLFLEIQVQNLGPIRTSGEPLKGDDASAPIFTHRYIPALGNKGKPLADSIVCLPSILPQSVRTEVRMAAGSKADIKWNGSDEYTHPTLHHIIGRLSELAVLDVIETTVARGDGLPPTYEDAYVI